MNRRTFLGGSLAGLAATASTAHATSESSTDNEGVAALPFNKDAFTIAVLPDTQVYAAGNPWIFEAQTQWIRDKAKARNIQFVLHLGDITDDNNAKQWSGAERAMSALDGVVPYSLCLGNHDIGDRGFATSRDTLLNEYFPLERYQNLPTFGGVFDAEPDRLDNSYHLFSAGGLDFLVLVLEFGPRDAVVAWANAIVAQYPDRAAILTTHAYLYSDSTRYDWAAKRAKQGFSPHGYRFARESGDANDGQQLWDKLVSKHKNFIMTLNGHVLDDGLGYLASTTAHGNTVHQMLVNFQMRHRGGDGFLRLLEFQPDGQTVFVKDYSPLLDSHKTGPENQFAIALPKSA